MEPFHQIHWPVLRSYSHTSLRKPVGCVVLAPYPKPPNRNRLPLSGLTHPAEPQRAPGTLVAASFRVALEIACVPYTPFWLATLFPEIHAQKPVFGSYFHRSLRIEPICPVPPLVPLESRPNPPKSQIAPVKSTHSTPVWRPPGRFPAAAVPCVPYAP